MSKKGESHVSCDRMSLGSLCTDGPPVAIRQEFSDVRECQRATRKETQQSTEQPAAGAAAAAAAGAAAGALAVATQ